MGKLMDIRIIGELSEKEEIDVERLLDNFVSSAKQQKIHGFFAVAITGNGQNIVYEVASNSEINGLSVVGAIEAVKENFLRRMNQ